MDILECESVTVELSSRAILKNISFTVKSGEICIFFGGNGAGKTTLLRVLSGLIKPRLGHISINGRDITNFSRKEFARHVCYLPQRHFATFDYDVIDFVLLGKVPHGNIFYQPTKKDRAMVMNILEEIGVAHLAYRPYTDLSSGEIQLVFLARALTQNTPFLFLDEPTSNLDFKNQKMVMDKIAELAHKDNKAVIVSVHDPNLAVAYCDCIIVIRNNFKILCKSNEGFYKNFENILRELYYPDIQLFQIGNAVFIK
jgi:iron complex transport system ATP-binding protein